MFVLALLGCQALASGWTGEENFKAVDFLDRPMKALDTLQEEENRCGIWCPPTPVHRWKNRVIGWIFREPFDVHELLDRVEKYLPQPFRIRNITQTHVDGGVWIHGHADEMMISAYMHPSKDHSAAIYSRGWGKSLPQKAEIAPPGLWSVAFGNPGSVQGNRAIYRIY